MESSFSGKRVLVTGAGQGIGRVLALRLSQCSAKVIALSKTESHLLSLERTCSSIQTICVDLENWEKTRELVEKVLPIDLLVNNAGIGQTAAFVDVTPEDFERTFNVNVKAVLNVSQIVAKDMIKRKCSGSIVNVSSQASKAALEDHAVYGASKAALDMLSKVMAVELGKHKIRVNTVHPTVVMTAMGKAAWSEPKLAQKMLNKIPLGRFAKMDEVVEAILFLLSDRSSMISGTSLPVDGGFLAS